MWCVRASRLPKVAVPPEVITAMGGENSLCLMSIETAIAVPGCFGASSR